MSEQQTNGAQQASAVPMHVLAQYVKDLSFENPNAPQSLMPGQQQPQVNIGVDVKVQPMGEDVFEVSLNLHCEAKQGEGVAFLVEVAYAGLVQLAGVPAEHHRPILLIEVPRMLFPFARQVVADATQSGGFPPLMINPIDFVDLYRRQIAAAEEAQAQPEQQQPF